MLFRQRDLLLVPLPFSDLTRRKVRPVVVLSRDTYNRGGQDVLVAAVTSNVSPRPYSVSLDTPQLESGAMRAPSIVRADKLFSIDQRIVLASIGRVTLDAFRLIAAQIAQLVAEDFQR